MKVQIRAEYACGHASRVIASADINLNNLHNDLAKMIEKVTTADSLVHFNCECGRGAAFVELLLDGKIISRDPASQFLNVPGAIVTKR